MYEGTGLLAGAKKFFGGEEDRADGVVDCNLQAESSNLSLKLSDGKRAIMLMRRCAVKHVSQDMRGKGWRGRQEQCGMRQYKGFQGRAEHSAAGTVGAGSSRRPCQVL